MVWFKGILKFFMFVVRDADSKCIGGTTATMCSGVGGDLHYEFILR